MRGQKLGVIRLNPVVVERLSQDGVRAAMHPRHLPMLVPPKPWLDYDRGGYLFNCSASRSTMFFFLSLTVAAHAMRFKDNNEQLAYLKHASSLGHVELVYAGLDVLGSTKWKINREVFDVVLAVWNSGQRLGKIPPAVFDVPEPEKLTEEQERDIKLKSVFVQRQKAWVLAKANNHSDRCNVNYKVEIASAVSLSSRNSRSTVADTVNDLLCVKKKFLGDTLYLPHNIDFRGRAYPIPPHLNHIGDDLSRGLLKFGEKKPLGERGLRWLKVHLANLYGFDKANFDERVQFADDHMDDVYDSAEKPLEVSVSQR
jgi:DNA-directed RNA polymerase